MSLVTRSSAARMAAPLPARPWSTWIFGVDDTSSGPSPARITCAPREASVWAKREATGAEAGVKGMTNEGDGLTAP